MKKAMAFLSSLLLVGAGCFSSSSNTDVDVNVDPGNPDCARYCEFVCSGQPEPTGCTFLPLCACDLPAEAGAEVEAEADVGGEVNVSITETVDMQTGNFYFKPSEISAAPGQTVNVRIASNDGFHTFVIDGITKQTVSADGTITFTAPTVPGEYPFYCDVGSHRAYGMQGTLFVE